MRKFKNRSIPRGILVDRGYVCIRIFPKGKRVFEEIGPAEQPGVLDMAIDRLNEIRKDLRAGKLNIEPEIKEITLDQACDVYYERHGKAKATARHYVLYLSRIREKCGSMRFHEITHHDVETFKDWLEDTKKQAVGSVNKHMGVFVHLFNFLRREVELGVIKPIRFPKQTNPAALVETDSEDDFTRTRVLTKDEFEVLQVAASPRTAKRIRAATFTLLRRKDLRQLSAGVGKYEGTQSKTGGRYQIAAGDEDYTDLDWTNFQREWRDAVKGAKLEDVQFRDLRRTGATWLFRATNDLGLVQRRLGHASPVMTKKYLGIMGDDEVKASRILSNLIADARPSDGTIDDVSACQGPHRLAV